MKSQLSFFSEVASLDELGGHTDSIQAVIDSVMREHATEWDWVNVIILPSDKHKELNNRYLGHDYATDVLTFPFMDDELVAGEIYLDATVMIDQANEYEVSLEQEYFRLVIHGILHLLGFDDKTDEEKKEMKALEDAYLKRWMA